MIICDSQVHAPQPPKETTVPGIEYDDLVNEMSDASVDRAIIVPLSVDPEPSLEFARRDPEKFAVMAHVPVDDPTAANGFADLKAEPGILGIRATFFAERLRPLLAEDRVEWLWEAAGKANLPVMVNAAGNVSKIKGVAERHPTLRLIVDHMGLMPFRIYENDLMPDVEALIALAEQPNVAVKASALPSAVREPYPFASLHEPIHAVVDAFGATRVFWGSDLTRLPCTYAESVRLFTDALAFLDDEDKEWVLGRGLCQWLGWSIDGAEV